MELYAVQFGVWDGTRRPAGGIGTKQGPTVESSVGTIGKIEELKPPDAVYTYRAFRFLFTLPTILRIIARPCDSSSLPVAGLHGNGSCAHLLYSPAAHRRWAIPNPHPSHC
jgi:hypothetical protein